MKRLNLLAGALFLVSVALTSVQAQSFEVAAIKPTKLGGGVTGGCHGIDSKFAPNDPRAGVPLGRCVITAGRLSHLMGMAYQMPLERISGFPEWDGPSRFDLEAKAEDPSSATEQQLLSMLQALLTDRFKLTLRHNTMEVPAFALVVGKNPPKLHPSEQEVRSPFPEVRNGSILFKGYSMPDLAEFLSILPSIGRPVHDMTGIQGRFDIALNILESKPETMGDLKVALATWQSAISDIQGQLGLKLDSTKAQIESIVIDHAEKPQLN
jgi:uncharacterized protein (TIGR03435 family)